MRRPLPLAALGLSLVLGTAGFHTPTQARVIDPERSERAGLVCSLAVVGVDGDNRLKEIYVRNRKVMGSTSSKKLGLRLTGLGMIDGETKDGVTTTRLAATSADGVPRQVSIVGTETSKTLRVSAIDFAQQKFKPRLFTDAYGYYAYTINHVGVLQRWTLTRLRSGKLAYRAALTLKTNLKNTVALAVGRDVFLSQHIGDLETPQALAAFERAAMDLPRLYGSTPCAIACDLHPHYASTRYARTHHAAAIGVQHHYAHVLACMAEHDLRPPVLGVCWDGTGYGPDGTIWGGEFLVVGECGFERVARFRPFPLLGGDAAAREPGRSARGPWSPASSHIAPAVTTWNQMWPGIGSRVKPHGAVRSDRQ